MAVSQSRRCDWSTAIGGKPPPTVDRCCAWKIGGAQAQGCHEPHTQSALTSRDPVWEGATLPSLTGVVSGRLAALKLKTTMSHILGRS